MRCKHPNHTQAIERIARKARDRLREDEVSSGLGRASAPPTGERATSDDWLPGVGTCHRIGREAELGACARDEPVPYPLPP